MSTQPKIVERFMRYTTFDTQSSENTETYPSTSNQLELGRLLTKELAELGLEEVGMDEHGYVMATLPANTAGNIPTIGFLAHMDTSPEVSGKDVKAQLHPNYDGKPIKLNDSYTLSPEQSPDLLDHLGHTIITSDGSTLLGADNKAGIAEIMTFIERLKADPSIPHGKIRVAFTCDEEVGTGTKFFDVKAFGADYAYTVDGEKPGEIENETFCADAATVKVIGINVHPGYAKDKLFNAIKGAAAFIEHLPIDMAPETTEKRQGYLHPVAIQGGVEEVTIKFILRDFDEAPLRAQRDILAGIAEKVKSKYPEIKIELTYEENYRNMRFILEKDPHVVEYALEAVKRAGLKPQLNLIRGGTDGARLSFMGLPTPNIFTGGHLFHSRFEWVAVEGMLSAVETLVQLVQVWVEKSK